MQKNDYSITVNSVIDNLTDAGLPDGEPEINIFTTDGSLEASDGTYRICFFETEEGQTSHSVLTVNEKKAHLKKSGAIESEMSFVPGESSKTVYRVGPYAFDMLTEARKIRSSLTPDGGEVQIIYSMNIGGQAKSVRMKITAKRK